MLKKKKNLLFASSLAGLIISATSLSVALSSCTTTNTSDSTDVQYNYKIDWDDQEQVKRLVTDNNGLVYADKTKTTVIAVSPKVMLNTITIPSTVKNISGYVKVTTNNKGIKVYQSVGAFQNMVSLNSVVLETGSQLRSISGSAFSGCTTLKSISGLTNSLDYIGANAFSNCVSLTSIDTSNVLKVDNYAFAGCTGLESVDLSKAIAIGDYAFQNCYNLTSIGSLEKATTIGQYAFNWATKNGSNITLKLSNLTVVPHSAFSGAQGITKVDFSNNNLLTTVSDNAFMWSSATEADFTGCSRLTSINERAFERCKNLTTVYLPTNDITNLKSIGWNAFINCTNLTTIGSKGVKANSFIATNKLSTIGANFLANTPITSVDLSEFNPNNSSSQPFGSDASLAYIPNLSSLTLPKNLTKLNACLLYGSGLGEQGGFELELPSTITSIVYTSSIQIANANNANNTIKFTVNNATPFTNSGVTSVDMSKITSYQQGEGSQTKIPSYLFNDNTKLKSVVLKSDTSEIGTYAFAGTTALNSITYPSTSNVEALAETTNGFIASNSLTSIGTDAFKGAFSETSNATVDLRRMTLDGTIAPIAFNDSKVVNLKLPTSVRTINANSFDNMSKLESINFEDLTTLTTITAPNFNKTNLTSIDLSKVSSASSLFSSVSSENKLFTDLPANCVVSLPSTIGNFRDVFKDKNNNYVTFKHPNGISSDLFTINSNTGVLNFNSNKNTTLITNASHLNLTSLQNVKSIGSDTFFGSKLSSLILTANGISNNNIFTAGSGISANTSGNTSDASGKYIKSNVPFGNNESLTSLDYINFTSANPASIKYNAKEDQGRSTPQQTLFNTTNNATWSEVAKIINSLSYQTYTINDNGDSSNVSNLKSNMSNWTPTDGANNAINNDATATLSGANDSQKVALSNSYATSSQLDASSSSSSTASNPIEINATETSKKFIHNGITWTYSNDGSTIKLTGQANMYKATNGSSHYLVFFNQSTYSTTGTPNKIYYVPSSTPVNVTLTIATKQTTQTK